MVKPVITWLQLIGGEDLAVNRVQSWLPSPENPRWLLIFDDYDEPLYGSQTMALGTFISRSIVNKALYLLHHAAHASLTARAFGLKCCLSKKVFDF